MDNLRENIAPVDYVEQTGALLRKMSFPSGVLTSSNFSDISCTTVSTYAKVRFIIPLICKQAF